MSRVTERAKKFYKNTAIRIFNIVEDLTTTIRNSFVIYAMTNRELIGKIEVQLAKLRELRKEVKPLRDVDSKIVSSFTPKMKRGYCTARNYTRSYLLKLLLESLKETKKDERLQEIYYILSLKIPTRLKDYLVQSSICYFAGLYDSSVTLIGRAVEFTLKEFLRRNKIQFDDESTLGELIKIYENSPHKDKKTLKHIIEVNKIDRNISSHDNPKRMSKKDANHMRTAIIVILKDLLNLDVDLIIER